MKISDMELNQVVLLLQAPAMALDIKVHGSEALLNSAYKLNMIFNFQAI